MKTKIIFFTALVIITGVFISMKTMSTKIDGPHGGRIQSADKFNIETKMVFPHLYAYLLNEKNIPISNKGLTCNIEFFFLDNNTQTLLPLKPEGADGFSIETNATDYSSYRITFVAFGKTISTKFENENVLVKGN